MTKKTDEETKVEEVFELLNLKEKFVEYYSDNNKSEKEIWETAIICLDANVMLELYRMPEETRNSYFEVFEKLKDRIVIPYQAMTEFFDNRFEVIKGERLNYESVLDGLIASLEKTESNYGKTFRNPVSEIDTLLKEIRKNIENTNKKIKKLRIKQIPSYFDDHILYKLTDLFQTRLHAPFNEEKLKEFYKEGDRRYKDKCPPGYMDVEKDGNRQYGDYIIWEEMKSISRVEGVSIIFISNDKKEDWRHTKGASHVRHELLEEFKKDTKHQFFMYKLENLPEKVKEFLEPKITDFVDDVHEGYGVEERVDWNLLEPSKRLTLSELINSNYIKHKKISDSAFKLLKENNEIIEEHLFGKISVFKQEATDILKNINSIIGSRYLNKGSLEDLIKKYMELIEILKAEITLSSILRDAISQNIGVLNSYCHMLGISLKAISFD